MKTDPNKAFHRTAHKAPPVNADVGSKSFSTPIYDAKEDVHGCDI